MNCIKSLVSLQYPNYRVYIIDDGSADNTFGVLNEALTLLPAKLIKDSRLEFKNVTACYQSVKFPYIYVIQKENGGKADALNAGISFCREEIVITLDADCMLREDALSVMNKSFQRDRVVAAGGTVHITQSVDNAQNVFRIMFNLKNLIRYQVLQYLMAFYMHKYTQALFKALIVISGAFGAFRRELLIDIKGYRHTVGEDMDITLRIHQYIKAKRKRYTLDYLPQSVCYTECPETLKNLMKQRIRWQKAFIDCAVHYGYKMFWRFNTGVSLFFILDYLILGTATAFLFLMIPVQFILSQHLSLIFVGFFSIDFICGLLEGIICVRISGRFDYMFSKQDYLKFCLFLPVHMIGYRFLNLLFVVTGTFSYIFNRKHWNKAERLGRYFPVETAKAPMRFETQK